MVQLGSSLCQAEFDLDLKNRSNPVLLRGKKKNYSKAYRVRMFGKVEYVAISVKMVLVGK